MPTPREAYMAVKIERDRAEFRNQRALSKLRPIKSSGVLRAHGHDALADKLDEALRTLEGVTP